MTRGGGAGNRKRDGDARDAATIATAVTVQPRKAVRLDGSWRKGNNVAKHTAEPILDTTTGKEYPSIYSRRVVMS